jgi:hypothetical protein
MLTAQMIDNNVTFVGRINRCFTVRTARKVDLPFGQRALTRRAFGGTARCEEFCDLLLICHRWVLHIKTTRRHYHMSLVNIKRKKRCLLKNLSADLALARTRARAHLAQLACARKFSIFLSIFLASRAKALIFLFKKRTTKKGPRAVRAPPTGRSRPIHKTGVRDLGCVRRRPAPIPNSDMKVKFLRSALGGRWRVRLHASYGSTLKSQVNHASSVLACRSRYAPPSGLSESCGANPMCIPRIG